MRKFFCDICRRETAVEERLVRIGIPTLDVLDEEHSKRLMDVCQDCDAAIVWAIKIAEVDTYNSIVAAACQSADEPSEGSEVSEDDGI